MMNYLMDDMEQDKIVKRLFGNYQHLNVSEFLQDLEELYLEHISQFYFPGDVCVFYPKISEHRARVGHLCDMSGAKIQSGSFYYCYRPFIENLSTGKKYVLKKTMHAEIGYYDYFPKTLFEFEQLALCLENSYNDENSSYQCLELSKNFGETLELQELICKKKVKL